MSSLKCPVVGCTRLKATYQVCCRAHWKEVPALLRHEIWMLYKAAPGSVAHRAAVLAAIQEINARQPPELKVARG